MIFKRFINKKRNWIYERFLYEIETLQPFNFDCSPEVTRNQLQTQKFEAAFQDLEHLKMAFYFDKGLKQLQ